MIYIKVTQNENEFGFSVAVIQSGGELVFRELVIFGSRLLSRYTIAHI